MAVKLTDVYGNPQTRSAQYKSIYLDGVSRQFEWLLNYYAADPAKSPNLALYKELADDAKRELLALEKQIAKIEEKKIDFTTKREELNSRNLNSALQTKYKADRSDVREEYKQKAQTSRTEATIEGQDRRAKEALAARGKQLSKARAQALVSAPENMTRASQDSYTNSAGNIATGFQDLNGKITGTREFSKTLQDSDATYFNLREQYVADKAREFASQFPDEDPENIALMARAEVDKNIPAEYQDSIIRHEKRIEDEATRQAPKAQDDLDKGDAGDVDIPLDALAAVQGLPFAGLSSSLAENNRYDKELARLREAKAKAEGDFNTYLDEYKKLAASGKIADPIYEARKAMTQAYFPGTMPAYEQNRLMQMALLQGGDEAQRQKILEGFQKFKETEQPIPALERADIYYRRPGGFVDRLFEGGLDRSESLTNMPSEVPTRMSEERKQELLQGYRDILRPMDIPLEEKIKLYDTYKASLTGTDPEQEVVDERLRLIPRYAAGKEGPRQAGDTLTQFDQTTYSPETIEAYRARSQAYKDAGLLDSGRPMFGMRDVNLPEPSASVSTATPFATRLALVEKDRKDMIDQLRPYENRLAEAIALEDPEMIAQAQGELRVMQETLGEMYGLAGGTLEEARLGIAPRRNVMDLAEQTRQEVEALDKPFQQVFEERGGEQVPFYRKPAGRADRKAAEQAREDIKNNPSIKAKDSQYKGEQYVKAIKLVREGKLDSLLKTPTAVEVRELYTANKAKGDQSLEDLLSYIAQSFPREKERELATQTLYGLEIRDIESKYLGTPDKNPLKPVYEMIDKEAKEEEAIDYKIAPEE